MPSRFCRSGEEKQDFAAHRQSPERRKKFREGFGSVWCRDFPPEGCRVVRAKQHAPILPLTVECVAHRLPRRPRRVVLPPCKLRLSVSCRKPDVFLPGCGGAALHGMYCALRLPSGSGDFARRVVRRTSNGALRFRFGQPFTTDSYLPWFTREEIQFFHIPFYFAEDIYSAEAVLSSFFSPTKRFVKLLPECGDTRCFM